MSEERERQSSKQSSETEKVESCYLIVTQWLCCKAHKQSCLKVPHSQIVCEYSWSIHFIHVHCVWPLSSPISVCNQHFKENQLVF